MKKILGFVKRNKILLSGATLLMIVALLGIQITPTQTLKTSHAVSIGSGQKYEVTIADKVLAAGLSADYTCNGTNDNVVWQNAINAVPANGGIVNDLTGGLYVFAATVNVPAKVTINGIGRASYFSNNGVTPIFTSTGNGTCYQNISTDNGGISTGATTGWLETNVAVGTTLYTERSPNSSIVDNTFTGTLITPTGRTASYVIAASDAPASWKAQADYVCNTTDISPAITAGIAALMVGNLGGTIQISPTQTSTFGATVVLPDVSGLNDVGITINGSGWFTTSIALTSNNDMFTNAGTLTVVNFTNIAFYGSNKAYSFFNGAAYNSNFQNCQIHAFGTAGIIETKDDAGTYIQNCIFSNNGTIGTTNSASIVIGNGTSHVYIKNNQFAFDARSIQIAANSGASNLTINDNIFGVGAANGIYIQFEWASDLDIFNNKFEITPSTVQILNCPATNSKFIVGLNFHNNFIQSEENLSNPIISLTLLRTMLDININDNHWDIAQYTIPSCIKLIGGNYIDLHVLGNTINAYNATVTNGFIDATDGGGPRLSTTSKIKNNYSSLWFSGVSPTGLMAAPFADAWGMLGLGGYDGTPVSAQVYVAIQDYLITSVGGGVTNIVIKDAAGNTRLTGVTTLNNQLVLCGESITWTWAVTTPTVTVFGN